ncbi:hypothetical protein BJX65DRAFT_154290 [Aspergillus insuetus]
MGEEPFGSQRSTLLMGTLAFSLSLHLLMSSRSKRAVVMTVRVETAAARRTDGGRSAGYMSRESASSVREIIY